MSQQNKKIRRQIYLTPQQVSFLSAIADARGLAISELIRRAIDGYFTKKEIAKHGRS